MLAYQRVNTLKCPVREHGVLFLRQLTWENRKVTWENHPKNGDIMVGQLTIGMYFNNFNIFYISNKNMEHHRNLVEEGPSNNEFVGWSSGNYFREEHP